MPKLPSNRLGQAAVLLAGLLLLVTAGVAWQLFKTQPPAWLAVVDPEPMRPPVKLPAQAGIHGDAFTVTYDVRDLVNFLVRLPTSKHHTKQAGPMDIDQVVKVIVETVPADWGRSSRLEEINGTQLVVHTSKKRHDEVVDLLDALRRLNDVAVLLQAQVYELDRTIYQQQIAPALVTEQTPHGARCGAAVPAQVIGQIIAAGAKGKHETAFMVPNGETARVFSRRQVLTSAANNAQFKPAASMAGVVVQATVSSSIDRRCILVTLDQEVTEPSGARTVALIGNETDTVITTPNRNRRTLQSPPIEVVDGGALVLPLLDLSAPDSERVNVLVLQPTLQIEAEEQARREEAGALTLKAREWLKRATGR